MWEGTCGGKGTRGVIREGVRLGGVHWVGTLHGGVCRKKGHVGRGSSHDGMRLATQFFAFFS